MVSIWMRVAARLLVLGLLVTGSGFGQSAFPDWYPTPVRFTLEIRFDGEVADVATYWIGERALRAETSDTTILLVDEDGPVLYFTDAATGAVDRLEAPDLSLVGTMLPFGSADHPCNSDWPCTLTGEDEVDGRAVEVWEVEIPGLGTTTAWVDIATRVQVRSRGVTEDGTVVESEVVEMDVGPQPAERFVPPTPD